MDKTIALDCSLALAWYLEDERTEFTEGIFEALTHTTFWVPALWMLEFPNALIVAVKRGRISDSWRRDILQRAALLPLRVDSTQVSMDQISDIATTFNITTYDAAYLELALRRQCKLATLDQALIAAARRAKHPIVTEAK